MAANKRTKDQVLRDRELITSLVLRGWTHQEITDHLNNRGGDVKYQLSRSMVSRDIIAVRKQTRERITSTYKEYIFEKLSELGEIKRAYWKGFEKSLKSDSADPRFLSGVKDILLLEMGFLGLDQDTVRAVTQLVDTHSSGKIEEADLIDEADVIPINKPLIILPPKNT